MKHTFASAQFPVPFIYGMAIACRGNVEAGRRRTLARIIADMKENHQPSLICRLLGAKPITTDQQAISKAHSLSMALSVELTFATTFKTDFHNQLDAVISLCRAATNAGVGTITVQAKMIQDMQYCANPKETT